MQYFFSSYSEGKIWWEDDTDISEHRNESEWNPEYRYPDDMGIHLFREYPEASDEDKKLFRCIVEPSEEDIPTDNISRQEEQIILIVGRDFREECRDIRGTQEVDSKSSKCLFEEDHRDTEWEKGDETPKRAFLESDLQILPIFPHYEIGETEPDDIVKSTSRITPEEHYCN